MEIINISNKLRDFEEHLNLNRQTIVSAKFGDGKTYFLNKYIEQHEQDTFFIVLHPVNYVVSSNEDIFEYIKRDILCSLVHRSEFQETNWDEALKELFRYDTILETVDTIATNIPCGNLLTLPFHLFKKVDDKFAVDKYFDRFKNTKGGLFEFDQFTFAIQQTLNEIKKNGLRTILIIEDLDRIDPEHLFRILNVLGAHVDEDKNTNKFGFDNIVAVLDYDTTRHIFHHFYGEKANYEGYMSKFMSSYPFEYSITKVAHEQLEAYLKNDCRIDSLGNFPKNTSGLSLVEKINNMSVRDVEHVLNGIEHQIIQCDVEVCTSTKIRPIDYSTKLFSVLVKMNYKVSSKLLANYFGASINNLRVLNNYLLTTPNISGDLIKFQRSLIGIYMALDGDYSIVTNIGDGSGYMSDIVISEVIDKAINIIKKQVKDCDQVVI